MTTFYFPTPLGISRAGALLQQGALVALPTETVYGLGPRMRATDGMAGSFTRPRGRPSFNPLIIPCRRFVDSGTQYWALFPTQAEVSG